jgi:hypothetical protein
MPHLRLKLVVSIIAAAGIVAHFVFKIQIDGVTLGLLCLGSLPWLAPLIKSVEIPGVGKIEMQEVKAQAEQAKGAAESAVQKVELVLANAVSKELTVVASEMSADKVAVEWQNCAEEYKRLRDRLPSGSNRTSLMTQVVSRMLSLAPLLSNYDVTSELKQGDRGRRLGAYVFLYARPEPRYLQDLVSSVTQIEDKPFGQYWGILAIQKVLGGIADPVENTKQELRRFLAKLKPGTDRYYELSKILQEPG